MDTPVTNFQDESLMCYDCHKPFTYTAKQQEIHAAKGYEHKPKRCEECRRVKDRKVRSGPRTPHRQISDSGLSDRDLILEVGKSVSELRVYLSNEFRKLHNFLDEVFPLEEDEDQNETKEKSTSHDPRG